MKHVRRYSQAVEALIRDVRATCTCVELLDQGTQAVEVGLLRARSLSDHLWSSPPVEAGGEGYGQGGVDTCTLTAGYTHRHTHFKFTTDQQQ